MRSLVLIGLMGSGKSSIGSRLAARLDLPMIDLDDYIVAKAGRSIPEIFATEGEAGFRKMETEALREVIGKDAVIATGGGVVLSEENRALLRDNPPVVWLMASPEFLARRVKSGANRPLLAGGDPLGRLRELAKLRNPLYKECADFCVQRDGMDKERTLETILRLLSEWRKD